MKALKKTVALALATFAFAGAAFAGPKVGLVQLVEHPSLDEIRTAIEAELKEQVPDVEIEYQNGQNTPSLINSICQKFVGNKVDLIVAIATPAAQGAMAAAGDIPVVFGACSDPEAAGLVKDLKHPEGNVTGTRDVIPVEKVFDLALQITPQVKSVGIIYNPGEINSALTAQKAKADLEHRGLKVEEGTITNSSEVASATSALLAKNDALFVPNDNTVASAMPTVSELAIEAGKPVYASADSLVHDGALATVGVNYTEVGRQTGDMAAAVLKGTAVKDLPVREMDRFAKVFNEETAAALHIDLTPFKD